MVSASRTEPEHKFLLSLVVPFHNSWRKAQPLLRRLAGLSDPDVEIILVDDGSTDGTAEKLGETVATFESEARLFRQANKGPGGARNHGLAKSRGEYVWFVDSDDDIFPEAIDTLRQLADHRYDFVDFNYVAGGKTLNSMGVSAGEHSIALPLERPIRNFGRLWTKMFRKQFILENRISYPENCIYEDNALGFILPFACECFFKTEAAAYKYVEEHSSITRGEGLISDRHFDRMYTAVLGYREALSWKPTPDELRTLQEMFVLLFLVNTIVFERRPEALLLSAKVMRAFHTQRRALDLRVNPVRLMHGGRLDKAVFQILYAFSYFLPPQDRYFQARRDGAWGGKVIVWPGRSPASGTCG